MPVPTWAVGQVLAASDVNSWFVPLAAYKSADEQVTSSATLQNDDALFLSVAANARYWVRFYVIYDGATGGDFQVGFTTPASSTFNWVTHGLISSAAASTDGQSAANQTTGTPTNGALGAGNKTVMDGGGVLVTAGTAGTLQFQWAQGASSGTATTVYTGSALVAWRIG